MPGKAKSITVNNPRTLVDKVVESLAYCPIDIEIPSDKSQEDERRDKSDAERFIYGCLNLANSMLVDGGFPVSGIQGMLGFYSTLFGITIPKVFIHKEKQGGETIPEVTLWDPNNTAWRQAGYKMLWACNRRSITIAEAQEVWGFKPKVVFGPALFKHIKNSKNNSLDLYEWFDRKVLAVSIGNEIQKSYPYEHELERVPVMIGLSGAVPILDMKEYSDTMCDSGEGILAADRNLYPVASKIMSLYMTIVEMGANNPLAFYSEDGEGGFERDPYYAGAVVHLDASKGEKVEKLVEPNMPKDAADLFKGVSELITMGGLSPLAWGFSANEIPYSSLHLLTHSAASVLEPRKFHIEKSIEWIARELLLQYGAGGFKALKLHGRSRIGEYFQMEIESEKIKGDWWPQVKLDPRLPRDEMQQITMAQMAVVSDLLDPGSAREKYMNVKDSDSVEDRILEARTERLPAIQLIKVQKLLHEKGYHQLAQALPMMMQAGSALGMGNSSRPLEIAAAGGPATTGPNRSYAGVEHPQFAHGTRAEVIPDEQYGARYSVQTQPADFKERLKEDYRLNRLNMVRGKR